MRIEVKERDKNFFDECLYITYFNKRVLKKPNKKVFPATKMYLKGIVGYLLCAILFMFMGINDGFSTMTVVFMVIFFWFAIIMIYNLFVINKQIKLYMRDEGKSSFFEINDEGVKVESYN